MVYIPFPRIDLDSDADLTAWRAKIPKVDGDWRRLRAFLHRQSQLIASVHVSPKCWFSEIEQLDRYAQDTEHFRPKASSMILEDKDIREIEKLARVKIIQNTDPLRAYAWLAHDYRNYRLVTALTNRGGAKEDFFPLVQGTNQLPENQFPWGGREYPFYLDPVDADDAAQLTVLPSGMMTPRAPITDMTTADIEGLPATWHNDSFNYIRAWVTIYMFRLNEKVFIEAREEIYHKMKNKLAEFENMYNDYGLNFNATYILKDIYHMVLPSAKCALAARCALQAYTPSGGLSQDVSNAMASIPNQIMAKLQHEIAAKTLDWNRP